MEGPPYDEYVAYKKPCNSRIDQLAKPNKRLVLALWDSYSHDFSPERREAIRHLLQELYAMTPEETAKYFARINTIYKTMRARKKLRQRWIKREQQRQRRADRKYAYIQIRKIVTAAINYATTHPVPPMVSIRVRGMADIFLEQLCTITEMKIPERTDTSKQAQFLMSIADWLAIAIEHVYFHIHVAKDKTLDMLDRQRTAEEEALNQANYNPLKAKKSSLSQQGASDTAASSSAGVPDVALMA